MSWDFQVQTVCNIKFHFFSSFIRYQKIFANSCKFAKVFLELHPKRVTSGLDTTVLSYSDRCLEKRRVNLTGVRDSDECWQGWVKFIVSSVTVTFIIITMLLKIIKHWYPKICFQAVKLAHYGTALSPDERWMRQRWDSLNTAPDSAELSWPPWGIELSLGEQRLG